MTAEVPPAPGGLTLPSYPPARGVHPPLASPDYRSSLLRAPHKPLVPLPQGLTEVTGPLLGEERVTAADADLTGRHGGARSSPALDVPQLVGEAVEVGEPW